ncbi:hypothetical protein E8E14_003770 [Neopestalotiopsis sp. 37M]|nr:hypothetical protein E8E14_003770 [Neopestalotiopsis sp. 37M]
MAQRRQQAPNPYVKEEQAHDLSLDAPDVDVPRNVRATGGEQEKYGLAGTLQDLSLQWLGTLTASDWAESCNGVSAKQAWRPPR